MAQTQESASNVRSSGENTRMGEYGLRPQDDLMAYLKAYAREKPDVAALWCFGIGFVLGWKLKPW